MTKRKASTYEEGPQLEADAFTQQETADMWEAIEIACGCIQVVSPRSPLLKRLRELQKRE